MDADMTEQPPAGAPATGPGRACPQCHEPLEPGAQFCSACGAQLGGEPVLADEASPIAPEDEAGPISTPTRIGRPVAAVPAPPRPCTECGGEVGEDLYCTVCGTKAPSERDHFRETPAAWVAGVCDRGIVHSRNEDAMALSADAEPARRAAIVVCDGVSSSKDSDVASLAAARAALEVLRPPPPKGLGVPQSVESAATKVFVQAAESANTAVIANTEPSSPSPASCTFVAATVEDRPDGATVRHAALGDSRAYLLPDGGEGRQLTTDDSMAQQLIAGGMPREEAETSAQAHAITKWLGTDSPDIVPVVGVAEASGPGWVLVCSDGLWNYASEPSALRTLIDTQVAASGPDPAAVALSLVEFAKSQGGRDNITVVLARIGDPNGPVAAADRRDGAAAAPPPPAAPVGENATSDPAPPSTDQSTQSTQMERETDG